MSAWDRIAAIFRDATPADHATKALVAGQTPRDVERMLRRDFDLSRAAAKTAISIAKSRAYGNDRIDRRKQ